jgi:hypothetical protein
MTIYPHNSPDGIIELVEKREYDKLLSLLESEKATRNAIIKKGVDMERAAKQEFQDAVKRMEEVTSEELDTIWMRAPGEIDDAFNAVRARLISAAKGES